MFSGSFFSLLSPDGDAFVLLANPLSSWKISGSFYALSPEGPLLKCRLILAPGI